MEEIKTRLALLLEKTEWTRDDKQWLLKYLDDTESEELQLLMLEAFSKRNSKLEGLHKKESLEILTALHERVGPAKPLPFGRVVTLWQNRVIAAVFISICIIISGFFVFNRNRGKNIAAIQRKSSIKTIKIIKNDVTPGTSKAMLTLADGSTIVLDDAKNGTLAQQGRTKVFKMDGKLVYNGPASGANEVLFNTIATPRGGEYQVMLPDGSQVWLNAASSLRFPTSFAGQERRVEITGEAYFEVAKNAAMPFIVTVNNSEIRVLGTHFNVMAYGEEAILKTTLLEGAVRFTSGNSQTFLKPGQQSQLVLNGGLKVVNNVNLDEAVAWKNGMFHFEKTGIEMMMRQLSRWYNIEVVYMDGVTDEKFIADIPRNTNLSDALKALELTGKIKFKVADRKVLVW
jgi:transmembrane sensor